MGQDENKEWIRVGQDEMRGRSCGKREKKKGNERRVMNEWKTKVMFVLKLNGRKTSEIHEKQWRLTPGNRIISRYIPVYGT